MTALVLLRDWQSSQVEFWRKTIFEGYDVSNFGNIRSHRSQFAKQAGHPIVLARRISRGGYPIVHMQFGKKRLIRFVHRLVAEAFCSKPNGAVVVNHLTAFRLDARADGLEWTTHAGNMGHARRVGLYDTAKMKLKMAEMRKARWRFRTIPDEIVRTIRNMAADGVPHSKIRKWTGVDGNQVEHIIYQRRYKDVV